ncbi:DNA-directed RNA polymerase sigma-70 factor [Rhizocola hellebori]|uniref:DNA-directed RNA polymerase sigma-70 factor n=1 Tax=Rhizocola hellebori TaxID=1392758 RepID=A0A8J3VGP5_9ACTN|nr:sigma-70 family RNA polymerase sigma factor [Rhizocola hellebori]GIH05665.1 DNA-directed RNA polymerase sigma-70 factor [Rhizocola hellebori]
MDEQDLLARRFEAHRAYLCSVASRILGSDSEAQDAAQETWVRLSRHDADGIDNLQGWLTTVIARICLDRLRSRKTRREVPYDGSPEPVIEATPEDEAVMAGSIGAALMVVVGALAPAERIAFVLHDIFSVPFDEVAKVVGRSPGAAKMLASRARQRIGLAQPSPGTDMKRQNEIVEAFLAASRNGDFEALLSILAPDVEVQADAIVVRGAANVASRALTFSPQVQYAHVALINGTMGIAVAPGGHLVTVLAFRFAEAGVTHVEVIADPARLRQLTVSGQLYSR